MIQLGVNLRPIEVKILLVLDIGPALLNKSHGIASRRHDETAGNHMGSALVDRTSAILLHGVGRGHLDVFI